MDVVGHDHPGMEQVAITVMEQQSITNDRGAGWIAEWARSVSCIKIGFDS